jgi:hypothetical protein
MYHQLPTVRADGVDDAGDPSGARHLRNEGIVSIHAYLWEEGKRKGRKGGTGKRKGRVEEEHLELLVEEDARLLVCALHDAQRRTTGWRRERKLMGCGNRRNSASR